MVERPAPVRDLDWDPKRARAFTDGVADIYEELLTRLRDLPVSRGWGVQEVRDAVVVPVPDEPMPEDELLDYLARMTTPGSSDIPASTPTSPAPGPCRAPQRTCSPQA